MGSWKTAKRLKFENYNGRSEAPRFDSYIQWLEDAIHQMESYKGRLELGSTKLKIIIWQVGIHKIVRYMGVWPMASTRKNLTFEK